MHTRAVRAWKESERPWLRFPVPKSSMLTRRVQSQSVPRCRPFMQVTIRRNMTEKDSDFSSLLRACSHSHKYADALAPHQDRKK